jgi:integrase
MPRARTDAKLQSRTSRRSISQGSPLHIARLFTGLALGYRKGKRGGTWIARRHEQGTKYRFQPLGVADDFADADGVRVLSFDQAQDAARGWFKRMAAEDMGEVVTGSHTVARAIAEYLRNLERLKRRPQARMMAIAAAHILPILGHIELSKLSHGKVKAWRDGIAEAAPRARTRAGHAQAYRQFDAQDPDGIRKRQASTNRVLTVLKAALNYAYEERRVASKGAWERIKPFRRVDLPKVRFLSPEEVTALIRACAPDFERLVKGALLTGARYGELTALRVADFQAGDGRIYISTSKNGESRYVDLNSEGVAFFVTLTKNRVSSEEIFLRASGTPWKTSEQQRPMDAACLIAKIKGVTFHILRHTYASHSVMNGMPIEVLAEVLGHKDTRITMRHYAHFSHSYKREIVRAMAPGFDFGSTAAASPTLLAQALNRRGKAKILPMMRVS